MDLPCSVLVIPHRVHTRSRKIACIARIEESAKSRKMRATSEHAGVSFVTKDAPVSTCGCHDLCNATLQPADVRIKVLYNLAA